MKSELAGVTKDEIEGVTPVDLTTIDDEKDEVPFDTKPKANTGRERCFGQSRFYEAEDVKCQSCKDFTDCGKAIDDIPY